MTTRTKPGAPTARRRSASSPAGPLPESLSPSIQVLPLPPGLYVFSVTKAAPSVSGANLRLPALHVGIAPGASSDDVELVSGCTTQGGWLYSSSDVLVLAVKGTGATLLLTSVRQSGGAVISIKVERVQSDNVGASAPARPSDSRLPVRITAHIRAKGDTSFLDVDWAGKVAPGLWIESFSVHPLRHIEAGDLEYKALTGTGFETPWLSDGKMCGTRGLSTPLLGFAVRLKQGVHSGTYEVQYSGYFQSGVTVGPVWNGAPCRSSIAGDPLEGIQIRVVRYPPAAQERDVGVSHTATGRRVGIRARSKARGCARRS